MKWNFDLVILKLIQTQFPDLKCETGYGISIWLYTCNKTHAKELVFNLPPELTGLHYFEMHSRKWNHPNRK